MIGYIFSRRHPTRESLMVGACLLFCHGKSNQNRLAFAELVKMKYCSNISRKYDEIDGCLSRTITNPIFS